MNLKQHYVAAISAIVLVVASTSGARAIIDNSQAPTPVLCTGTCGVGSAIGAVRQIVQINDDDPSGTSFTDIWTFTLSEAATISGSLFSNNTLSNFQLNDLNVILQNGDGLVTYDPITGYTVPNPPPSNMILQATLSFAGLTAGDYQFVISGLVPGSPNEQAGQYQLQGQISAVPLPAAVWLFLSAVLGLVSVSRLGREQNSS